MDSTAHDSWPFLDREHEVAAVLAGATGPAALAGVAGVHGVGKTALLRAVEKALTGTGWRVARLSGNGSDATVATLASLTGVRGGDHDLFDGARAALLSRCCTGRGQHGRAGLLHRRKPIAPARARLRGPAVRRLCPAARDLAAALAGRPGRACRAILDGWSPALHLKRRSTPEEM